MIIYAREEGKEKYSENESPGVGGGELVEAAGGGEDDEHDLGVAQHGELVGLLEQPAPALGEAHLPARPVLDPPQLHRAALPPPRLALPDLLLLMRRPRPPPRRRPHLHFDLAKALGGWAANRREEPRKWR